MTPATPPVTKRKPLAQLVFCEGCCCGRTDRGQPELPAAGLREVWRAEKLNRSVQLTISGCLGPCDLTNVTLVMTPAGDVWLGALDEPPVYEALVEWARACDRAGEVIPLPPLLDAHRFDRWPAVVGVLP